MWRNLALAVGSTALALGALDLVLIATGLFPPTMTFGDPTLGWRSGLPMGRPVFESCTELMSGRPVQYERNEDGIRTGHSKADLTRGGLLTVAVSGDSHTDLCATNADTHFGVLERTLREAGVPAGVFANGAGKYSPLQAYLAVRTPMAEYHARAFVLNLYTGNDFMDLLRIDDRPHLVRTAGDGYRVADPVWYAYRSPGDVPRSRILHLVRQIGEATGVTNALVRLRYLQGAAREQGKGLGEVFAYVQDLRRATSGSVGYPQAFTAQMLNQQLFFHHFTGTRDESVRRLRWLLTDIRRRHPDLVLVLSPIPSFQLVHAVPSDTAFSAVLGRLPITYAGGYAEEDSLYDAAATAARDAGWLFVDNRPALRAASASTRLYNTFDYHIEPVASDMIGRNEAAVLLPALRAGGTAPRGSQ